MTPRESVGLFHDCVLFSCSLLYMICLSFRSLKLTTQAELTSPNTSSMPGFPPTEHEPLLFSSSTNRAECLYEHSLGPWY